MNQAFINILRQWAVKVVITLIIITSFFIFTELQPHPIITPFTANDAAKFDFPLYYPTVLPEHYAIDPHSVNSPTSGVVVFIIRGPGNGKIYMSEEARPATFDFGGYYKNFADLSERSIALGVIATGIINNGQTNIASLATSKTWVLVNSTSSLKPAELGTLLDHLSVSH